MLTKTVDGYDYFQDGQLATMSVLLLVVSKTVHWNHFKSFMKPVPISSNINYIFSRYFEII